MSKMKEKEKKFAPVFASDNLVKNSVRKITVAQDAYIHWNWIRENIGVIERVSQGKCSQGSKLRRYTLKETL